MNELNIRRFRWTILIGCLLLLIAIVLSLRLGAVNIPFAQLLEEITQRDGIIFDYRLPRLIIAICIGINMAIAGAMLQGVTRNPLAAPDVIGITAGGGLATVILILAIPGFSQSMLPFFAFGGAICAGLLVFLLAYKKGIRPDRLALCGVAVSSGLQALITLFIVKYAPSAAQALVWLKGSLYARTWEHVGLLWPWTVIGTILALLSYRQLNVLLLSEEMVLGLGSRINQVRLLMIIISVALAGSAVAVAGNIGFIGLVIPHLARLLVGSDFRLTLPTSALLGAVLVVLADTVGRIVMPPIEIPVGIITSLIGAPYFVYLLLRGRIAGKLEA
ncbi:Fe(3+)-citrate import system permease protein YfmE [Paenibacillus baekrokdamisoli]|uniref:Fe(3+)-citrate import system permease protein YfmE n=1 Tax=Paenibacillus baekrokdamisoli TaxID=1712516 RepID=A0A3G9IW33_9BACL|nr:iron ABC transporter permease [Paenibacillus baekrokdamisoli]MBB3067902.1 iron complex transport system permease protein [Paenibacillus baekrokdamisoli]BBH23050.1 Fe(3+)-citrate import system permease protein YfmE [Paenibacillus baekrokdamisoli]